MLSILKETIMKKILFTILFLTSLTALSAQLQDSFLLVGSAGTFSALTDSTFRGTVTFQSDQFGSGYLPTGIQTNYKLIDAKGDIFTITAVNSSNFTTANIDVEEDDADRTAPAGIVMVFKVLDSGLYPLPPVNSTGASPIMQARLLTDNAIMSAANDNRLDSISQSGRTFTFNVGDSTYSMQSIDTFFLENGVYKIVIGTDTLSANLDINFGNVLYVSSDGNDNTAVKGDPNKPWARIDSAYVNSVQGDVIVVQNKDTLTFLDTVFLVNGKDFNLYLSDGAVLLLGERTVSATDVNSNINIIGRGTVLAEDDLCYLSSYTTDVYIDVFEVKATEVSNAYFVYGEQSGAITIKSSRAIDFNGVYLLDSNIINQTFQIDIGYLERNRGRNGFSADLFKTAFNPLIEKLNLSITVNSVNDSTGMGYLSVVADTLRNNNINLTIKNGVIKNRSSFLYSTTSPLINTGGLVARWVEDLNLYVDLQNVEIYNTSIFSIQPKPTFNNPSDVNYYFNGNAKIYNAYAFTNYNGASIETNDGTGVNYYVDMNIKSDSTIFELFNGGFYGDLYISGNYETFSVAAPIISYSDTSVVTPVPSNLYLGNINMEVAGSQKPIDGDGEIFFFGSATQNNDIIDADFTFTRLSDIGSNAIADRLAFGNYTIDQNTSSLRLDTLNQFVAVTENSQSFYSLGGNIEIRADSGNVVLNGGPTGELKMQGDSLTASITGAGVSNDGMTGVFVQNDAGETRLTSRLLPQFDTVNVSTANDTIDIDFAFDQTVVVNMNSAPATVDFVVQNPVKGSTLTLVFTSVGSSHTFNFGHTDIQLATKTGWTIDGSSAKVYVLRYNIDGGGDWIIVRDE